MSRRNLRSFSFLVFAFLLASSLMGCGEQGGSPSGTTPAPPVSWRGTQQFGTPFNDVGQGIARDSSANIYITGSTDGSLSGNVNAGQLDIFLAKFDPSGASLFTSQFGTPFNDTGFRIAVDSSANVFIAGSTVGNLDGNISAGLSDILLVKFNPAGVKQ